MLTNETVEQTSSKQERSPINMISLCMIYHKTV
jgi:hypothetical protein